MLLGIISLVVITSIVTFAVTAVVFLGMDRLTPRYEISFDPKKVNPDSIKKFEEVRHILENQYYQEVDENVLLEGAVAGMADALKDPYTSYFNKEQMSQFMEKSEGSYEGIGVSITVDNSGLLTIIEPFEDSPAKAAGIMQGDKIIKVDDTDVSGIKDENMVISMIKGKEGTNVKITVFRPSEGKSIDFNLVRKKIKIDNISSDVLNGNVGYIKIVMFDSDIANDFERELKKLTEKGISGLVIDLRDNPGGDYSQVVQIADRILPEGLIVYTEDRNKRRYEDRSDDRNLELPISVLINENSASASEILAGAIKDHNKGTLVGSKSFGKGLVQTVKDLHDGSGIKVTIARYYTPSGVCIQGIGIMPDVEVSLDEKYRNLPVSQVPKEDDLQLQRAIETLR